MDVETILAKAAENLSVRRAFGTAYERDGMLIIPVALVAGGGGGGAGTGRTPTVTRLPAPMPRRGRAPPGTTRHRRTLSARALAGASAGWYWPQASTS